ncbi:MULTISPECIES: GspE/PulE family protein [unclassified Polaromonas]|uniref:GspE/PulE family protein n=1 Tax=unclassified Polaromonas TaxID=2638319 RepID=UPI000F087452|nr:MULTISPECIES: GspE/PulE family protein [unclassified Polaromonas]AYQ29523.1 type II/IV secretion system protein [Polaromonas sp. SP1]QGJ19362.1 type II/IV secretion system protein [Polaromonas sp. Pch-P]
MNAPLPLGPLADTDPLTVLKAGRELMLEAVIAAPTGARVQWMVRKSGLEAGQVLADVAAALGLSPMSTGDLQGIAPDFELISFAECQLRGCLGGWSPDPSGTQVRTIVVSDPLDLKGQEWIDLQLSGAGVGEVVRGLALIEDIQAWLAHAERNLMAMSGAGEDGETGLQAEDSTDASVVALSIAGIETTANPLVRLVDSILYDALKMGASDIHFETQPVGLHVKYRIDGVLENVKRIDSAEMGHQAISRIKVLSELDISERRTPQDGRFKVRVERREIDFRVSIMPNLFGEDAVLRVLDRKHLTGQFQSLSLDTLSFAQSVKDFIRQASHLPYGLLLVTGPTGSGKTTTLYAAISEINTGLDKIITIEDPIEYQLKGVLQIPVNEKKGLTFARGLRSVLRHDPDKIMVGEIRDAETAQIAVQAALTGHQVFTTVHANNVFDVIGRFKNMNVDSYSLVSALTGIVAQRLLRAVCTHCTAPADLTHDQLTLLGIPVDRMGRGQAKFVNAAGCAHCRGTGYKGRLAIAETLKMDDEIRDLLVRQASISEIKQVARSKGFMSLRDSALSLAIQGQTTVAEINRVTPPENLRGAQNIEATHA